MIRDSLRPNGRGISGFTRYAVCSVAFGALLVALFWIVALRELEQDWQRHEEATEKNLESFARALDGHVGAAVRAIDASLLLLRREYVHHRHYIDEQATLLSHGLLVDGVAQIGIIGADGYLIYSNLPMPATRMYLGDREHFRFHATSNEDSLFISEPVFGRLSRKWTLQFTRKLLADDGGFAGVIVLSVDPAYFSRYYDSVKLGNGGVVTLAGTDRVIRARSSDQLQALGRDLAGFPPFKPDAGPEGHFHARSPIDLVSRLYTYRRLANLPLVVIIGVVEKEAFALLVEQRRDYLTAALLGTVTVAVFIALLLIQVQRQSAVQARYRHLMQNASDGMILCDGQGLIRDVNQEACRSLGCLPEELLGHPYADVDPSIDGTVLAQLTTAQAPLRLQGMHRWKGHSYPVETTLSRVAGTEKLILAIFRDISERRESEERMWHQAHFDPLTGLPNRALFRDRLDLAIAGAKRRAEGVALLFVDLDFFKRVNDTLGHTAGDALLRSVADRLHGSVREQDTVARIGGDEFCLILPGIGHREEAAAVARKILDTLKAPHVLDDHAVGITASVGIAIYPDDGDSAEALLKDADGAMYQAKAGGRDQYAGDSCRMGGA